MQKFYLNISYCFVALITITLSACSEAFLEVKPQKQQVIVETLQDVASLLDNAGILNRTDYYRMISDGDFDYTDSKVTSISEVQRNLYLWKVDIDPAALNTSPWDLPYQQIMYANIALETLNEMNDYGGNRNLWDELYGRALFFRAWAHYNLLQDFAEAYDPSAERQLGVPIITESIFPKPTERETLMNVYDFIIDELTEALAYLPPQAQVKTRPSGQATYALMARVYLNIGDFDNALLFADRALEIDGTLLDFNTLLFSGALPFSKFNFSTHPEIIFFTSSNVSFVATAGILCSGEIYSAYSDGDLRKDIFFNKEKLYTGTYSGASSYQFTGLASDELFLTKAESLVRNGRLEEGINTMEELLANRYVDNVLTVDIPQNQSGLLYWILDERQKEMVGRGTRWTDLKRLNGDNDTHTDLSRIYDGEVYRLPAESSRYVFAIPLDEIEISGLEQNIRE